MWKRRVSETLAILTIGDGAVAVAAPKGHALLWEFGPEAVRRVTRFFAAHPNHMRLLGAAQIGLGLWVALKQHDDVVEGG